jgi:heat-inducible transcriptional repressor
VVVITSTGGVTKRVISYDEPVDPGLVDWAGSYLSESLDGMTIGTRSIIVRLTDQSLGSAERAFLATLAPAFTELEETAEDSLYFGGAARLLQEERFQELSQINELMQLLERRKTRRRSGSRSAPRTRRPSCARSASSPPGMGSRTAASAR